MSFNKDRKHPIEANNGNIFVVPFSNGGSLDHNVDGSVTPVEFTLEGLTAVLPPGSWIKLFEISIIAQGASGSQGRLNLEDFVDITALTNGYSLGFSGRELFLRSNADFYLYASELFFQPFGQGGVAATAINPIFNAQKSFGDGLIGQVEDYVITVRDDLTNVDIIQATGTGIILF